jgi:hypothetical protein
MCVCVAMLLSLSCHVVTVGLLTVGIGPTFYTVYLLTMILCECPGVRVREEVRKCNVGASLLAIMNLGLIAYRHC